MAKINRAALKGAVIKNCHKVGLNGNDARLLWIIIDRDFKSIGKSWPGRANLAESMGFSNIGSISNMLAKIEKAGCLAREEVPGKNSHYDYTPAITIFAAFDPSLTNERLGTDPSSDNERGSLNNDDPSSDNERGSLNNEPNLLNNLLEEHKNNHAFILRECEKIFQEKPGSADILLEKLGKVSNLFSSEDILNAARAIAADKFMAGQSEKNGFTKRASTEYLLRKPENILKWKDKRAVPVIFRATNPNLNFMQVSSELRDDDTEPGNFILGAFARMPQHHGMKGTAAWKKWYNENLVAANAIAGHDKEIYTEVFKKNFGSNITLDEILKKVESDGLSMVDE